MDLSEIKSLLVAQGTAWEEFEKANNDLLQAKADGRAVGDLEAKVASVEKDLAKFDEIKAAIGSLETRMNRPDFGQNDKTREAVAVEVKSFNTYRRAMSRPGHVVTDVSMDEYTAYKSGFEKVVRHGEKSLNADEIKAMQAGVDPDGGYLLPPSTVGQIVKRVWELTPIRGMVNVQSISGNDIEGIEDLNEAASGGWVSETGSRGETGTPQVGKWKIEAFEMFAQPKITQRILDDSAIDVEAWLADKIANKFSRVEADAFVNGDGVGKPRGLFAYPTAATNDNSRAWGTFEHIVSGANGAFHTTKADPLFDLLAAFRPVYLGNASWLANRQVIALIRKLKEATSDQYLWQPGLQAGTPDRLLGYPISMSQDVPAVASGSLSMAFGDFREAYTIIDRLGIRTLRDPYTEKPYIKFYSTRRVGGGAVNYEAVKFFKFST